MNRDQNIFRRTLPAVGLLVLAMGLLVAVAWQETTSASTFAIGPTPECSPGSGSGFTEEFETGLPVFGTLPNHAPPGASLELASGTWHALNNSTPIGTTGVFGTFRLATLPGAYVAAMDYKSGSGISHIDTFLMSPVVTFNNGDMIRFVTSTLSPTVFPDRMRLVMSTSGASTDPADFTTVLLSVNENLTINGYPAGSTQFTATVSGLAGPTSGRFAFNYNVPNGGPFGMNSEMIGIDKVSYTVAGCLPPTPTPQPTPLPSEFRGVVTLSSSTFEETEGYTAPIGVVGYPWVGGAGGQVTTSDGTAVGGPVCSDGVDYITVDRYVSFFGMFGGQTSVLVVTCPDDLVEGDETLLMTLTGSQSPAFPPTRAVLTIRDLVGPTPTPSGTPTASPTPSCSLSYTYSNGAPIAIDDYLAPGGAAPPALPARSEITVSEPFRISNVSVRLSGYNHTRSDDIDLMLVGPGGENALIMSDVGGGIPFANVDLTIDDRAIYPLLDEGPLATGLYQPTNIGGGDAFGQNAPVPAGGSALSIFNGTMADGRWSLWAVDDEGTKVGSMARGWEITFEVCPTATPTPSPTPTGSPTPTPGFCSSNGSLDPTFDGDGRVTTSILGGLDEAHSAAVQSDGKIVAVGRSSDGPYSYYSVARFNPDGSLDRGFGGDGTVATSFGTEANAVAIQPDGKIIAAGSFSGPSPTGYDFGLVRYNPDGGRDLTFGTNGKVNTHILGSTDIGHAVAVQPDGKIVMAGYTSNGSNLDFAVVRYLTDGSLDTTFDADGKVNTHILGSDQAYSVAIQTDGKIVVAGESGQTSDFAVVRYNTDGSLDTTFDGDGKVTTPVLSSNDEAYSVAIQADGRIVVAGSAYNGSNRDFAVVRYNSDGSLDTTFDGDGIVTTPIGLSWDDGESVVIQPDGRIVVAGSSYNGSNYDFAAVRYNPDGSLDSTFDGDGKVTTPVGSSSDFARGMVLQPDGGIVLAGYTSGQNADFALVRYAPKCSASAVPFDYDGDGRTDISVFRQSQGAWYLNRSTDGFFGIHFGSSSGKIVPADYDGDGKTDVAAYQPSTGVWSIFNSATATVTYPVFGAAEDLPTPGDYDGDGKADISVFRPSQGTWYRQNSSNGSFFGMQFGATGDVPTVGDFDGDGKNDIGVWRPSNGDWYNLRSSNGSVFGERFGQTGDKIAPADYDGDGKTDIAIYRPSTGLWVVRNSATATYSYYVFGAADDVPVAGDYDGDGKADIGVWRPSDGTWYIQRSSNSQFIVFPWGQNGDQPTPSAFGN